MIAVNHLMRLIERLPPQLHVVGIVVGVILALWALVWVASCSLALVFEETWRDEVWARLLTHEATPLWSDGGTHIVFASLEGVFVVESDGSEIWRLPLSSEVGTSSSPGSFTPAISPDGTRVAYARLTSGFTGSEIFVSDLDGSEIPSLRRAVLWTGTRRGRRMAPASFTCLSCLTCLRRRKVPTRSHDCEYS